MERPPGLAIMTPEQWHQVEDLYQTAQKCPPAGRAALLAGADSEVRSCVEGMLVVGSRSGLLDRPAGAFLDDPDRSLVAEGAQLGQYKIERQIGAGGMGVVYRAFDTRLNRPVAIKFLHEELADAAARRRFQREAQMASSLNHPHIVTVHDVGELEGRQYLVTEFVDGGTLKDWAKQEPRTWLQIVELLTGVADAVAAAHHAGLLHRDIKPGNILISQSGYAKLADFGLARAAESTDDTRTRSGLVVGTVAYMSPEQASGQSLDVRSDVFSFGVVLYELLCGSRPFAGHTDLEVLHKVIHAPAPPLNEEVPAAMRGVVEKALEKDREKRYQTMRDLVVDLRRVGRHQDPVTAEIRPLKKSLTRWLPWTIAAALLLGFGLWERFRPLAPPENPLIGARFSRISDFGGAETSPAVSPDGKFVAFISDHEGTFDVWLSQAAGNPQNLTKGKAGDVRGPLRNIGFTGDGSEIWIAGVAQRRLQLIPLIGGTPRNFLSQDAAEVAWSPDNKTLVYHSWEKGDALFLADGNGANIRTLLAADADDHRHFPVWSQDGRWIFFARGRPATHEMDLWRISASGGQPQRLTRLNTDVAFPTPLNAHTLLYIAHDGSSLGPWLWALDLETRTSQRLSQGFDEYTALAATTDGRRLVASVVNSKVNLWSLPILTGTATEADIKPFPLPTARALAPRFGAGALYYLSSRDGADGLWSFKNGREAEVWKGSDGVLRSPAAISADGRIAIALRRNDKWLWHLLAADGTQLRALSAEVDARGAASWSPDGKWIVSGGRDSKGEGLFKIPADGGPPVRIRTGPSLDPVWSPAGDLIVYGGANVFTNMPLEAVHPDGTPVELPSIILLREGERARFLPDGSGLVYMQNATPSQDFWLLDLTTKKTRPLTHLDNSGSMRTFDITPDGKQIIFDRAKENSDIELIDLPPKPL